MGRPKKPIIPPPKRNPLDAWGDVPSDNWAERKRLARIVARDGRKIACYRTFCRRLGGACHQAHYDLYERNRRDQTAVRAKLDELAKKLADARTALDELGADATKALHDCAAMQVARPRGDNGESPWQWLDWGGLEPCGEERTEWVQRILFDCEQWAANARDSIITAKTGRPRDEVTRELLRELLDIWREQTGKKPTLTTDSDTGAKSNDLLEFCEAVIVPIWQSNDREPPSIADFIQELIYPPSAG